MAIEPGALRHRIVIEENVPARTPTGALAPNWTPVAERWAAIEPQSGREFVAARQVHSELTHIITVRGPLNVRPDMRVRLGQRILDIIAVMDVEERHFEIRLLCREGKSA